jgi:hypothetical protein
MRPEGGSIKVSPGLMTPLPAASGFVLPAPNNSCVSLVMSTLKVSFAKPRMKA